MDKILPVGKLSPELLKTIIAKTPISDPRVKMGPGIGLDCAVIENGTKYLVLKTDPITFATEEIGWYAVQIIANDIATTGAKPLWLMATTLLPENLTDEKLVQSISDQLFDACAQMGISFVNGHTEITHGISRPILSCALVGEVDKDKLVTPWGAKPGDAVLLTKGIPIEGTAILAKEFGDQLSDLLTAAELEEAKNYIHCPGIGVSKDARIAVENGHVTAMHDPTEGGLASALWELSEACGHRIEIDSQQIPISSLSQKICTHFGLEPINTIASGSLLLSTEAEDAEKIILALAKENIQCRIIGHVCSQQEIAVFDHARNTMLFRPEQDDITKVF